MLAFHGPDWQAAPASPTVAAAIYPQAVALTRLLASPHWQAMSGPGPGDRRGLFIAELRRTVAPHYRWPPPYRPPDPLGTWINQRCIPGYGPLFNYHSWPNSGVADTRRCWQMTMSSRDTVSRSRAQGLRLPRQWPQHLR
jgi:hypothetical protein